MDTITTAATLYTPPSTSVVHNAQVSLTDRSPASVVHLVQYDDTLPIVAVALTANGQAYTVPSGAAVNVRMKKPDGTYVYNPALGVSENAQTAYIAVTLQMAAVSGKASPIIEIVVDGNVAATGTFTMIIDENPVPESAIESTDEFLTIQQLAAQVQQAAKIVFDNEAAIQAVADNVDAIQQAPTAAANAAASATLAESWAVGGTGTREGENTNNAQYWCNQAQIIAQGALGWYETEEALQAAHPTGKTGQWAIVGATNTVWVWSDDVGTWVEGVGIRLYKVTFKTDSWGSSNPYTQTAAVTPVSAGPNVTANSQICSGFGVRDDFGTDAAYHLQRLIAVDLNRSKAKKLGSGTLTLTTNNKPKADIELYFLAQERGEASFGLSFPGGGGETVLLWENSETGPWSGRKIGLDLTAYDAILVISKVQSSHVQGQAVICYKNLSTSIVVYDYNSTASAESIRIAVVDDSGVTLGEAKNYGTSSIDNSKNWPYRIYGMKF